MSRKTTQAEPKARRPGAFQPGNQAHARSSNPRGRWITRQLILQLNEIIDDPDANPKEKTKKQAKAIYFFCRKLIKLALEGDTTAIKMVMDRIEGTPTQTVMYKDIPDGAETPEQLQTMQLTREKIAEMTPQQQDALFLESIRKTHSPHGAN